MASKTRPANTRSGSADLSIFDVSLETANRFYNAAWWFSIVGAGLTFLSIGTVFWSDSIRESFTERAIANANATAEQAREGAAKAHERAAALEAQAEQARLAQRQLEQSNLLVQRDLERERIERLRLEAEVSRLKPRKLSQQQTDAITSNIVSTHAFVHIGADAACSDCRNYSVQISAAIRAAGWAVNESMLVGVPEQPQAGLLVRFDKDQRTSPAAEMLLKALSNANVPFEVSRVSITPSPFSPLPLAEVVVTTATIP